MITSDGWFDWAERVPGHPRKVNAGINPGYGIFCHSAEGYRAYLRWSPTQESIANSWHLSNLMDGHLLQHYPLTARCWHATAANQTYLGMEHEGYQPINPTLTDAQIDTTVRVITEISQRYGWQPRRPTGLSDTSHTLWEHREVVRLGGTASACPSGRIPWDEIMRRLASGGGGSEEDEMIRHNATHADGGFTNRIVNGWLHLWNPWADFNLPAGTQWIRVEIFLTSGGLRIHDGKEGAYAGSVGWDGARYGVIDVNISNNGLSIYGDNAVFSLLGCVGRR